MSDTKNLYYVGAEIYDPETKQTRTERMLVFGESCGQALDSIGIEDEWNVDLENVVIKPINYCINSNYIYLPADMPKELFDSIIEENSY